MTGWSQACGTVHLPGKMQKSWTKANAAGKVLHRAQLPSSHIATAGPAYLLPRASNYAVLRRTWRWQSPFGQDSQERQWEIILLLLGSHHLMLQMTVFVSSQFPFNRF